MSYSFLIAGHGNSYHHHSVETAKKLLEAIKTVSYFLNCVHQVTGNMVFFCQAATHKPKLMPAV